MLSAEATRPLSELEHSLTLLNDDQYTEPLAVFSNGTLGQHYRHIIELFQILVNNYDFGIVNYDNRIRDLRLENNRIFALEAIKKILANISRPDKNLYIQSLMFGESEVTSSYNRELLYNIEHCIHHQAMIKIGFSTLDVMPLNAHFGLAPSTIQYKEACAR